MKWRIVTPDSGNQSKKISRKWLAVGTVSLLHVMVLTSVFLLAKVAVWLIIVPVIVAIVMRVASKAISQVLEDKQEDQNRATQGRMINLAVGLLSIFVGGLSLFTVAKIGLAATCAAVAALVLCTCFKDEKICKDINNKLDGMVGNATDFIVSNIEKLVPQQSRQV